MKIKKLVVGDLQENCYILIINNNAIIIDPGAQANKIISYIEDNKLNLLAILITHAHFDHIGALDELLKQYNVLVFYNNVNNEINNCKNIKEKKYKVKDFKFEVIYTPGHRNDLVTYYFYENNVMFTGDFLFFNSVGRTDLKYGDKNKMCDSILKIKKYNDNIVVYSRTWCYNIFRI